MSTMTTDPGVDLVHAPAQTAALAPMTPEQAKRAMDEYQAMCKALLVPDDGNQGGDLQRIGQKDHPKRSAMQKLAAAYGVSTKIIKDEVDYDDDGNIRRAKIVVRAIHPTGRVADGDGTCTVDEPNFRRGNPKIDHNVHGTAVTRAKNRAIGDLIAFGAVSAEEIGAGASPGGGFQTTPAPAWAAPVSDVGGVAQALTNLFEQVGVSESAQATAAVGQLIFDDCDGGIPICVARAVNHVADVIRDSGAQPESADAEPVENETTKEESTT